MGVFISLSLIKNDFGYYFLDLHSNYDMSNGRSFLSSPFNPKDAGFFDQTAYWHYGASALPFLLNLDNIFSPFESAYLGIKILLSYILLIIISYIKSKFRIYIPFMFLVFLPLMPYNSMHNFASTFSPSFTMGHTGNVGLILILVCFCMLAKNKFSWLFLGLSMLLFIKASHFLVLFGGSFLYLLKTKKLKEIFIFLTPILGLFLFSYFIYFSNAHLHNFWILFPWPIFTAIQIYGFTKTVLFTPIVFLYLLLLVLVLIFYIKTKKTNNFLLAASSISLSGLLGCLLLTEITESNSIFFLISCSPFLSIILIYFYSEKLKNINKVLFYFLPFCIISMHVLILSFYHTNNYLRAMLNLDIKQSIKTSMKQKNSELSTNSILEPKNSYKYLQDIKFDKNIYSMIEVRKTNNKKELIPPDVSFEFINTFQWLKNNSKSDSIMFNPIYYLVSECPRSINDIGNKSNS